MAASGKKQKIVQTFQGLAGDTDPIMVPLTHLADCKNFLFERGLLRSRPGIAPTNFFSLGAGNFVDSVCPMMPPIAGTSPQIYGTYKNAIGDTAARAFRIDPLVALSGAASIILPLGDVAQTLPANLTGGYYPQATQYDNSTYISGFFDAGNNPQIVSIVNTTHVAAAITVPGTVTTFRRGRPYPIFTHLSRVFLVDPGVPAISRPTVYWSKIGDPTVWTGHYTTGNVQLQEAEDGIRAAGVLHNMILLARPSGFHVGVPTGNSSNPYDWKAISRMGPGCHYPESFCIYGDMAYYVGDHDVYTYDMQTVTSIGEGITNELFFYTTIYGLTVRAFVTDSYGFGRRPQLHLIPTYSPNTYNNGGSAAVPPSIPMDAMPHFVYDIAEQKWSRHIYDAAAADTYPFEGFPVMFSSSLTATTGSRVDFQRPCLIRRSSTPQYMMWDPAGSPGACESVATFTTGMIDFGDPSAERKIVRVMIVAHADATAACTMDFSYYLGNTIKTASVPFTLAAGQWQRTWINTIAFGSLFSITVTVPAGKQTSWKMLVIEIDDEPAEVRA